MEIRIPAAVYQDGRLSCAARLLYGEIDRRCRMANGICRVSARQLAETYAIALGSAGSYIRQLEMLGYVKIFPGRCNSGRLLCTTLPSEPEE